MVVSIANGIQPHLGTQASMSQGSLVFKPAVSASQRRTDHTRLSGLTTEWVQLDQRKSAANSIAKNIRDYYQPVLSALVPVISRIVDLDRLVNPDLFDLFSFSN